MMVLVPAVGDDITGANNDVEEAEPALVDDEAEAAQSLGGGR